MTVTFFGHKEIYDEIDGVLEDVLIMFVEKYGADNFFVGNNGKFDYTVLNKLRKLKTKYPIINYAVVPAYLPKREELGIDYKESTFPEGLETVPPKFAIVHRNKWMLKRADTVVVYVKHNIGGAAQFKILAEKAGKRVINLYDI